MPAAKKENRTKESVLKKAKIDSEDVLSYNEETHSFVTVQGGKYRAREDGSLLHLSGPVPEGMASTFASEQEAQREISENRGQ